MGDGSFPLLSPDGERLLYYRSDDKTFVLADGDRTEPIGSTVSFDGIWSPAGDRVLLCGPEALTLIDIQSKATRDISHSFRADDDWWAAAWRPNDDVVIFGEWIGESASLHAIDLESGEARPLGVTFWQLESTDWLPDGSALLVNAAKDSNSAQQIWLVDYPSGVTRPVIADGADYNDVRLAAEGDQIVARQTIRRSEILVSNPGANGFTRIKVGTGTEYAISWTADGRLVYSSNEAGSYDLYVADPTTGASTRLTFESMGSEFDPATTPDGRHVVFVSYQSDQSSLWRIGLDGTGLLRLTGPIERYAWMRPRVSPDGRRVIYMDWTNGPVLSMVGIDGGEPTFVRGWREGEPMESREYAFGAGWSPDGTELAFFHFTHAGEWTPIEIALSALTGPIARTFSYTDVRTPHVRSQQEIQWSPDGASLFFQRDGNLWAQPVEGGLPSQITFFDESIGDFDWSRDGEKLACTRTTELNDAVLIKNFR